VRTCPRTRVVEEQECKNLVFESITPVAIDNDGRIAGRGATASGAQHGFLFQPAACSN
jgi:probable HAF family extracellular repeat protein